MNDLEFEHLFVVQEISKTILVIDENEDTVVIEEEKKTHDELVLKELPKNLCYAFLGEKKTHDELVLKELPKNLCYAFLGENDTKPVIISSALNENMETKLLEELKKNMEAFALSIEDIKGISPSVCMHKILMEEHTPSIEHQRRLNPTMKKVVKK